MLPGWADAARQAMPERAGVLASFILNAAMIPGWPPPRPIEGVPLQAFVGQLGRNPHLTAADKELLLYLANMGLTRRQLARLLRKVEVAKNKSRLLLAFSVLATNLQAAAKAFAEEIAARAEEFDETEMVALRSSSGRSRLSLR